MRISLITNMELPGEFVLHAETQAEELFLRQFGNVKDRKISASCGGNIGEGRVWLTVTHLTPRALDEVHAERTMSMSCPSCHRLIEVVLLASLRQ